MRVPTTVPSSANNKAWGVSATETRAGAPSSPDIKSPTPPAGQRDVEQPGEGKIEDM